MTFENPFSPVYSRASFLETAGAGEVLRRLEAGLGAREPFLLLTGESGTGKTTLVHEAIARWSSRVTVAHLAYPALTEKELLEAIVLRFGGEPADGASRPRLMMCLEGSLAEIAKNGHSAMIVVDHAQRLPPQSLDEVFLVVNALQHALPLEVLLVGSPELEALIEEPRLAPLRERLSVRARLEPLSSGETRRYLRHRSEAAGESGATLFTRKICLEIAALTGGIPRRIDTLAGEALRIARQTGETTIGVHHLRAAADRLAGQPSAGAATEVDDEDEALPSIATDALAGDQTTTSTDPIETQTARAEPIAPRSAAARSDGRTPPTSRTDHAHTEELAVPASPASHDPGEWIARFVGDQGPIRIGSQVATMSASAVEAPPALDRSPALDAAPEQARKEGPPAAAPEPRFTPRFSKANGLQLALSVLLAITVVSTIALVIRARDRHIRGRHPSFAAITSGASSSTAVVASRPRRAVITRVQPAASSTVPTDSARSSDAGIGSRARRYTIAVGEFDDLQAAFDERERVRELTGMDAWVVPASDTLGPHRIVLGIYRSRKRAEATARMLLDSRTLDAAAVAPLPKREARE